MPIVFVSPIGGKIPQIVVLRDVKETHAAIKFFLNLWYLPTETFNLLQIAEESSEMEKKNDSVQVAWRFKQWRKTFA